MRVLLSLLLAASFMISIPPARSQEWCGFIDKEHSQVRCGYSSLAQCKQSLGDKKDVICMPSPSFAKAWQGGRNG
jgi:hypothetical protein